MTSATGTKSWSQKLGLSRSAVWQRIGESTMSRRLFILFICVWTTWGIGTTLISASISEKWQLNPFGLLGLVIISLVGTWVALRSNLPIISLMGYTLVSVSLGLILGPFMAHYTSASVVRVFFVTASLVIALGILGAIIPTSIESWGTWLFGGLVILLVGNIGIPILATLGIYIGNAMTVLDWVGIVLFCGYIIYDMNRAMHIPYTLDNSIDCALAIYLDWVNLLIRILEASGKRKD
jgi:FtsH-binding integral membrane protein